MLLPGALLTLGAGLAFPAVTVAATAGVARSEAGLASGVVNTSRQVGGSLGLAGLATLAADHAAALTQVGHSVPVSLTGGFGLGFAGGAAIALAAGRLRAPGAGSRPPACVGTPDHRSRGGEGRRLNTAPGRPRPTVLLSGCDPAPANV